MAMTTGISKVSAILAILFLFGVNLTSCLDIKGANESSCFPVKPDNFNLDWAVKHNFYFLQSSRSHLYHLTAQLWYPEVQDPSTIEEGSIYYDACIRWRFFHNSSVILTGYGGTKMSNYITAPNPAVNGESFYTTVGGLAGNWWVSLTDNQTYGVAVACSTKNEIMWGIFSTVPVLPPLTLRKIIKHVKEMGFKEAYFTELRHDLCPREPDLYLNEH